MNNKEEQEIESIYSKSILIGLTICLIYLEAIMTLLGAFKKGFRKKQVLSETTNLGFDLNIFIKS